MKSNSQSIVSETTPIVALLGLTRNTENFGVRVLLTSAVESLAKADPSAEIVLFDYGYQPEVWTEQTPVGPKSIRLINLRFSWRLNLPNNVFRLVLAVMLSRLLPVSVRERNWGRNPWLREILRARAHFSISGGDSFSDIYGMQRFLYVALPQVLVLLMQRPLVLLPQTYGPFDGWFARRVARYILKRSRTVFSRDEIGLDVVREVSGSLGAAVQVVPDIGLAMTPEPISPKLHGWISEMKTRGPLVGLNVSSLLYMGGYTGDNMFRLRENFPALIDALVEHLVVTLGARVLLVPHVCGGPGSEEDESRLCQKLEDKFRKDWGDRVCSLNEQLNHRQMKAVIGGCDLFLGARMHACIAAVSQGVPSVCLAYSKKFAGVMKPLGNGVRVSDLRVATIPEILAVTTELFRHRVALRQELQVSAAEVVCQLEREFVAKLFG